MAIQPTINLGTSSGGVFVNTMLTNKVPTYNINPTIANTVLTNRLPIFLNQNPTLDTITKPTFRDVGPAAPYADKTIPSINVNADRQQREGNLLNIGIGLASSAATAWTGIPSSITSGISSGITNSLGSPDAVYRAYSPYPVDRLNKIPYLPRIQDYRSRLRIEDRLLDGTSAAIRSGFKSFRAAAYAAATAAPGGAYTLFNREMTYGMGDPGDPYALRKDFTARSNVATVWQNTFISKNKQKSTGTWRPTKNPVELSTAFRGDKVNVVDFGQRKLTEAYLWKPSKLKSEKFLGKLINKARTTNDFIKFMITGPKLTANQFKDPLPGEAGTDDIFAFRCTNLTVSDSYNAAYSPVNIIGRADPNYHYGGYTRDVSVNFVVHATDRDELKPIWRKLNFLAGYTAPEYNSTQLGLTAPWLRITIGDLFVQQPALISSLGYELASTDTNWEINIEQDPTNMQVPQSVSVSMTLYMITDTLPQKGGRMYTLAQTFDENGIPKEGNDNWLSDAANVAENPEYEPIGTKKKGGRRKVKKRRGKKSKNKIQDGNEDTAQNLINIDDELGLNEGDILGLPG